MVNYIVTDEELTSIANKIRQISGISNLLAFPDEFNNALGNNKTIEEKDVNFIDYDGTLLYSYTAQEAQALTELPVNPTHEGLTSQGWNYTLAQVKSECTAVGGCTVGQMYITNDGKTRLYLHFNNDLRLSPYLSICPNGTVTIDWGDNSNTDTLTGTSLTTNLFVQHTYPSSGDYVLTIAATSGKFAFYGTSSTKKPLRAGTGDDTATAQASWIYAATIKKIELGLNVVLGENALAQAEFIETITTPSDATIFSGAVMAFYSTTKLKAFIFPSGMTTIPDSMFNTDSELENVSLAPSITSIGNSVFNMAKKLPKKQLLISTITSLGNSCFSTALLDELSLPPNLTTIGNFTFSGSHKLASVIIPASVTSIGSNAFANCCGMKEYHFLRSSSVPTIAATNTFSAIPSDCIIYVPYSSDHSVLNAYKTATNWSTYASQIQEEPV